MGHPRIEFDQAGADGDAGESVLGFSDVRQAHNVHGFQYIECKCKRISSVVFVVASRLRAADSRLRFA